MKRLFSLLIICGLLFSCQQKNETTIADTSTEVQTGNIKLIPIETPVGNFKVWTKRVGNNPTIKVLLLHGGPACTHEYFEFLSAGKH